jgi:hypothetical protein
LLELAAMRLVFAFFEELVVDRLEFFRRRSLLDLEHAAASAGV